MPGRRGRPEGVSALGDAERPGEQHRNRRMITAPLLFWLGVAQASTPVPPVPALQVPRFLVVPFETPARDPRIYWPGEALAVLVTDDINARGLGAFTRTARERAYDQLHLPSNAVLSRATVIRVGQIVEAEQVIIGEVHVEGNALSVQLRPIRIDVGRAGDDVIERGELEDLFALAARAAPVLTEGGGLGDFLAWAARRAGGAVPGGTGGWSGRPPSLKALEQYIKGRMAEQPASRAPFLEPALKLEPSYDRARLPLWAVA